MFLWDSTRWKKFYDDKEVRTGLRMRFDKGISPEVKWPCHMFCEWVRDNYDFPIRLPIYFKASKQVKAPDGTLVSGKCFLPTDRMEEPHISIATGDFEQVKASSSVENAIFAQLCSIAHEITYYYQWINDLELSEKRAERQAIQIGESMVNQYLRSLGMSCMLDIHEQWETDEEDD